MYQQFSPQSAAEYMTTFRSLAAIIESAIESYIETLDPQSGNAERGLQRLTEAVHTLACLRGDNAIFDKTRPDGLVENQAEMYEIEHALKQRLVELA